jgi:hypothetical protein
MDMPTQPPARGAQQRWRSVVRPEWLIHSWLELLPPAQARKMRELHEAVVAASPSLVPCVKWGNLIYLRDGRPVVQLTPHRHAVHMQLPLPRHLRGRPRPVRGGPGAGTVRYRMGVSVDADEVGERVRRALRLGASPRR